jgi:hypothetical protein
MPSQSQSNEQLQQQQGHAGSGVSPVKVEHSKSAASKCADCHQKLSKGELRIEQNGFHHVSCFGKKQSFDGTPENIDGFQELTESERETIKEALGGGQKPENEKTASSKTVGEAEKAVGSKAGEQPLAEEMPPQKRALVPDDANLEAEAEPLPKQQKLEGEDSEMKKQDEVLSEVRRLFLTNMVKSQLVILLKHNNIFDENISIEEALEQLVDGAVFGVPEPCPDCSGIVGFNMANNIYACLGCGKFETDDPKRKEMKIPSAMEDNDFISSYTIPKLPKRILGQKSAATVKGNN